MPEGMTSYDGSSLVLGPGETAHSISGNSLDNQINGSGITDYIYGGGGNDQVWGNNGDDVILGESGNDNLYGGNGNDLLLGGEGNDILIGNNGNDRLWGGTIGKGTEVVRIRIDRDSDVPIREQLAAQIVFLIGTGELAPGDALPHEV